METRREERLHKLLQALKETDKVHLRDAALSLGVSEMTIRRDLNINPSPLTLLGGYIVLDPKAHGVNHYFVSEQKSKHVNEKCHIGKLAAALIEDKEVVFFDSGTTTPFIIDHISDECHSTGVCYSLNAFLALQEKPNCTVILCGGEFKTSSYIFNPIGEFNELNSICPNKAFISAAGISLEKGLTTFILDEVKMKMQALKVAQELILVADHYKLDQVRVGHFGTLDAVHTLITDCMPNPDYQTYLKQHNIALIY